MGQGTGQARQHEEPGVDTQASLTGDLEIDLEPDDVWTLGQLIEADVASFPPGVAQEIMTGYRILQGAGYRPADETDVELRGAGDVSGLALPEGALDDDESLFSRQIVVAELVEQEPASEDPAEEGDDEAPAQPADDRVEQMAAMQAVAGEHAARLAEAVERLAEGFEAQAEEDTSATPATTTSVEVAQPPTTNLATVTVDWALIGLSLTVSTVFVIAAGFLADPVFAILGLALLGFAAFQSYPYLADSEEGPR